MQTPSATPIFRARPPPFPHMPKRNETKSQVSYESKLFQSYAARLISAAKRRRIWGGELCRLSAWNKKLSV